MTNDFDPQDPKITAYALGELSPDESATVEKLLSQSTDAQRAVRDIRKTVGLLKDEFQQEAKPSLTQKHRQTIEQKLSPRNAVGSLPSRRTANRSRKRIPAWATACLLLVVASVWAFQSDFFKGKNGSKTEIVANNEPPHNPELLKYERNEKEDLASGKSSASAPPLKNRVGKREKSRNAGLPQQEKTLSTTSNRKRRSQPFKLRSKKNRDADRSKLGKIDSPSKSTGGKRVLPGPSSKSRQKKDYRSSQKSGFQTGEKLGQGMLGELKQQKPGTKNPVKGGQVLRIETKRRRRVRTGSFRDAYNRFYLLPQTSKNFSKQKPSFARKNAPQESGKSSLDRSRAFPKNATKDLFKRRKKTNKFAKRISSDNKKKRFFKLQNLDKNKKSLAETEEKPKETNLKENLDAAKEKMEADLHDDAVDANRNEIVVENEFLPALRFPNSIVPLDVGTASYSEIVSYIAKGQLPPPSVVRIEELLNAFQYTNLKPKSDKPFAVTIESGQCPWSRKHTLVRIGIEGKEIESGVNTKATPQPPLANDVKLIVQFNPAKVGWHRLIGYEHGLSEEEQTKDENDFPAGHSLSALYEIAPANRSIQLRESLKNRYVVPPQLIHRSKNRHELLSIELSYKLPGSNRTRSMIVPHTPKKSLAVSNDFNWAAAVAMYGLLLRNSHYAGDAKLELVRKLAKVSKGNDPTRRRQQFIDLVDRTIKLVQHSGK